MNRASMFLSLALAAAVAACGGQAKMIPGTDIRDTPQNDQIIDRVEEYRLAVERKDAAALVLMASDEYWEDSGTPTGADDYGYDGLQQVLRERLAQVEDIRYSLRYMDVRRKGSRAFVDVIVDASYSIVDARGKQVRRDMQDQNQFVLVRAGEEWKFLSGM